MAEGGLCKDSVAGCRLATPSMVALHRDSCHAPTWTSLVSSSCPPSFLLSPCGVGAGSQENLDTEGSPGIGVFPLLLLCPQMFLSRFPTCVLSALVPPPFSSLSLPSLSFLPTFVVLPLQVMITDMATGTTHPPCGLLASWFYLSLCCFLPGLRDRKFVGREMTDGTAHFSERHHARTNQPASGQRMSTHSGAGQDRPDGVQVKVPLRAIFSS